MIHPPAAPDWSALCHLAEHMATLSGLRSRESLQAGLVQALVEVLRPTEARLYTDDPEADGGWTALCGLGRPDLVEPTDAPLLLACCRQAQRAERPQSDGQALSFLPLATDRGTDAVLALRFAQPVPPPQERLAERLLQVYRQQCGLLEESHRDSLTGLLNRKTFDETFMRMAGHWGPAGAEAPVADPRRQWSAGDPCYLAVVDIDHFKSVNDQWGHLIGDEVLLLVARRLQQTLRHSDRVYRFGGEEFVALLRCPDADRATCALERLRLSIAREAFPQVGSLTVSVGFTRVHEDDTPQQAFGRADGAVYAAKAAGRDRVVDAGTLAPVEALGSVDFF